MLTTNVGDFSISHMMISVARHEDSTEISGDTSSLVIGYVGYNALGKCQYIWLWLNILFMEYIPITYKGFCTLFQWP